MLKLPAHKLDALLRSIKEHTRKQVRKDYGICLDVKVVRLLWDHILSGYMCTKRYVCSPLAVCVVECKAAYNYKVTYCCLIDLFGMCVVGDVISTQWGAYEPPRDFYYWMSIDTSGNYMDYMTVPPITFLKQGVKNERYGITNTPYINWLLEFMRGRDAVFTAIMTRGFSDPLLPELIQGLALILSNYSPP